MAAPLPQEPCPLNISEASVRQSAPSWRISRSIRFTAGPYPRSKSWRCAKEAASASWSIAPWLPRTATTEHAISVSSVHCQPPGGNVPLCRAG
jgi:hypothetical protein